MCRAGCSMFTCWPSGQCPLYLFCNPLSLTFLHSRFLFFSLLSSFPTVTPDLPPGECEYAFWSVSPPNCLSVCLSVCLPLWLFVYVCMIMYVCIMCMRVRVMFVCLCACVVMCVCVPAFVYVHVCVCVCICVCLRVTIQLRQGQASKQAIEDIHNSIQLMLLKRGRNKDKKVI